ncbi:MAG: hypothetical protein CMF46_05605 [Legionellales bacterium]|nr:hypothetical protein [Legionellales bacterium]
MAPWRKTAFVWLCLLNSVSAVNDSQDVTTLIKSWADNFVYVMDNALFAAADVSKSLSVLPNEIDPNVTKTVTINDQESDRSNRSFNALVAEFSQEQLRQAQLSGRIDYRFPEDAQEVEVNNINAFSTSPYFLIPFWMRAITYPAVDPLPDSEGRHGIADPVNNLNCFLFYLSKKNDDESMESLDYNCNGSTNYIGYNENDWMTMDTVYRFDVSTLDMITSGMANGIMIKPEYITDNLRHILRFYMAIDYYKSLLDTCRRFIDYKIIKGRSAQCSDNAKGPCNLCLNRQNLMSYNNQVISSMLILFDRIQANETLGRNGSSIRISGGNIEVGGLQKLKIVTQCVDPSIVPSPSDDVLSENYDRLNEALSTIQRELLYALNSHFADYLTNNSSTFMTAQRALADDNLVTMPAPNQVVYKCIDPANPLIQKTVIGLNNDTLGSGDSVNKFIYTVSLFRAVPNYNNFLASSALPLMSHFVDGVRQLATNPELSMDASQPWWIESSDDDNRKLQFSRLTLVPSIKNSASIIYIPSVDYDTTGYTRLTSMYRRFSQAATTALNYTSADETTQYLCSPKQLTRQQASWRVAPKSLAVDDQYGSWTESIWTSEPVTVIRHIGLLFAELFVKYNQFQDQVMTDGIFSSVIPNTTVLKKLRRFKPTEAQRKAVLNYDFGEELS